MTKQLKVAIYARVSTDEQSTDAQLRDLRQYAASRNWNDVREFIDEGVSGSKDSRPSWNSLWDALQKGQVNVLLVHALDRLGRSLPHLVKIISTCVERGITLVSFRENIDLSTSTGRMIVGIFSVLAEYERQIIIDRTRSGMRAAKARGSQIGQKRRHFDKRKATRLRDAGWGQIKIARELGVGVGRVNQWVNNEYIAPDQRDSR
ncbi:recombinase family protein [Symmachiella dynata]|uniref:recombinase family protein n=1 Tax=Symmachiella dynata TaxID=2527995 RepID=UPI0030EC6F09